MATSNLLKVRAAPGRAPRGTKSRRAWPLPRGQRRPQGPARPGPGLPAWGPRAGWGGLGAVSWVARERGPELQPCSSLGGSCQPVTAPGARRPAAGGEGHIALLSAGEGAALRAGDLLRKGRVTGAWHPEEKGCQVPGRGQRMWLRSLDPWGGVGSCTNLVVS